jgi:hypothetical protein
MFTTHANETLFAFPVACWTRTMSSVQIDWIDNESGFEMGRKDGDDGGGIHLALRGCGDAYICIGGGLIGYFVPV